MVGLLIQQILKLNNNTIIGTDIKDYPLKISKELLSDYVINSNDEKIIDKISDFMGTKKIDIVFDCVCLEKTVLLATEIVKKGGKILCIGIPPGKFAIDIVNLICKEITLGSSYLYKNSEFKKAINFIKEGKINLEALVTKSFPLLQAREAYKFKIHEPSIKVILKN